MFVSVTMIFSIFLVFLSLTIIPNVNSQNDARIVGGSFQSIINRPYQAVILRKGKICGGSILSENWILTAAHCTINIEPFDISVAVGAQNVNFAFNIYYINRYVNHPNYNKTTQDCDISLLKLVKPIKMQLQIKPIELETKLPASLTSIKVSGYGRSSYAGDLTYELNSVELQMMDFNECKKKYDYLTENMFCAFSSDFAMDACQGDSGGPMTYNEKLIGVVSFGEECAKPGYPGVYTSVPKFISWINDVMTNSVEQLQYSFYMV